MGNRSPLIAVDVGNSSIHLGLFEDMVAPTGSLPKPSRTLSLKTADWESMDIELWLAPHEAGKIAWRMASVNAGGANRLAAWLRVSGVRGATHLDHQQLPLTIELEEPNKVGLDRLLAAVAANHLRPDGRPAIVIDLGTAITVDAISRSGAFCGGAILPGVATSARALAEFTDLLPDVGVTTIDEPPPALGTTTEDAIKSGLYFGAVGAARLLVDQFRRQFDDEPFVLLTGGAAPSVAAQLDADVRFEPHLVLAGIVLSG